MHPGSSMGPFSSWGICLSHVSAHQRCFCLRPLWSRLVLGRPLWLQGPIPIFFLILPMVPLEVAWLITGEAPPGFHLLGSHSMGHLHLEDRIYRVWPPPNNWGCTTLRHLLEMTHCHRRLPLPGVDTQDGPGHRPQPQGWWQQKPWSYEITAYSQRYGQ